MKYYQYWLIFAMFLTKTPFIMQLGCDTSSSTDSWEDFEMNPSKRYPKNYIRNIVGILIISVIWTLFAVPAVSARAAAPEIRLNVKTKTLVTEKTYPLKVYNLADTQTVTFKSDNPETASVDENGLVTALSVGNALITVTVKDAARTVVQLQCEITVGPPAISVKLTTPTVFLMCECKVVLKTIVQPLNTAENVKFSSLKPEIAGVTSGGRVTAKALGSTYIIAAVNNGKYDVCNVIVVDEATYQTLLENPDVDPMTLIPLEPEDTISDDEAPLLPDNSGEQSDETNNTVPEELLTEEAIEQLPIL